MTQNIPNITRRRALQSAAAFGVLAACDTTPVTSSRATAGTSVVAQWTNAMMQAVRAGSVSPPAASRAFAMSHTAGFVAANGISQRYGHQYTHQAAPAGANPDVVYVAAAARAATAAFGRDFSPALNQILGGISGVSTRDVQWAQQIGTNIASSRSTDGAATAGTLDTFRYPKLMDPMGWTPTDAGRPAVLPGWGKVRPWAIGDVRAFLPRAFPSENSGEFARQYAKVRALGGTNSTTRTADQTQIAFFWEDGSGSVTPVGHWQLIGLRVLRNLDTLDLARAMALLSIAQADAAIVTWDCKYYYDILRPETAIRNKGTANWQPLVPSPAFPAYVSGHSMFSGASARMLARIIGTDAVQFSGASPDPQLWPAQLNGVRRSWSSLSQAAAENGASREYGGAHWEQDNTEGLRVGASIADTVFNRTFRQR